jgi:hypothetical protein
MSPSGPHSPSSIGAALPSGAVEVITGVHSLVELKDGSLLSAGGWRSEDGGLTWSPGELAAGAVGLKGATGAGISRLASGALALTAGGMVWRSNDEGATWEQPAAAFPDMGPVGPHYLGDELLQLSTGRLIYPAYVSFHGAHPELERSAVAAYGFWRGQRHGVEGHGHVPEAYFTMVALSDDEGRTWRLVEEKKGKPNTLMGWFDEGGLPTGYGGVTGFGEATAAEVGEGQVLLYGRSVVNRVAYSHSPDGGDTWSAVLPTVLANSNSPPRLRRIPQTGDLLCVWNQVSREEVLRGYRRGRLTAAISRNGGASWECFRTLEVSDGLGGVERVPAETPIRLTRARHCVGQLPDGWGYYHYPNVCFAGDRVFISYLRGSPLLGIAEQNLSKQERVLRIYPLEWFYGSAGGA